MVCDAVQHNLLKPTGGNSGLRPSCIATPFGFFIGDNMKKIPLTQGKFALIDDEGFEEISKYKWCAHKNGHGQIYAVTNIKIGKKYATQRLHRLIMGLAPGDKRIVDHINRDFYDYRRINLRLCNHGQSLANRGPWGAGQFKGVSWQKRDKKWCARINKNRKCYYLGYFDDETEAAMAYDKKAKELFGEFAYLNFS